MFSKNDKLLDHPFIYGYGFMVVSILFMMIALFVAYSMMYMDSTLPIIDHTRIPLAQIFRAIDIVGVISMALALFPLVGIIIEMYQTMRANPQKL